MLPQKRKPRRERKRRPRDDRGLYDRHRKPWIGLVAILSACRAQYDPKNYFGEATFVGEDEIGLVIADPEPNGTFGEVWPTLVKDGVVWLQRTNFKQFLTKRRIPRPGWRSL